MSSPDPLGLDSPVGAYSLPIRDVLALVPDAAVVETSSGSGYDRSQITYAQVAGWIDDVTSMVTTRLSPWTVRLRLEEDSPAAAAMLRAMGTLVATGAASYLQAARFPEREGMGADSYAKTLWDRYVAQLDALAGSLQAIVDAGGPSVVPEPIPEVAVGAGAAGRFPAPLFPDDMRW